MTTAVVTRESVISLGGTRYSVPHQLVDQTVFVRVEGDEIVIAHQGRDGVTEVARHQAAPPGHPQLNLEHYPPRSTCRILDHTPKPRTPEEAAFLALGPGAASWRAYAPRSPARTAARASDLLNRDFTADAPNRTWVMDFTYVRCRAGFVYVAFVLDVFAQRIVAWNAATTKATDLVMTPLRMALWQRDREGHPVEPGELIGHADARS